MTDYDVAVIGAGPAGMAAALEAARGGVTVVVIDEQQLPGGQIYRQPPSGYQVARPQRGGGYGVGRDLIAAATAADGITWLRDTTVWGVFDVESPEIRVALDGPDRIETLSVRALIIAAGAYDLPIAFPGWTLPGVMAAGGVQAFVKSQQVLPGRRFVLAGAHPLLFVIADQLLAVGADVAAVTMAQPRPRILDAAADVSRTRGNWSRYVDLGGPLMRLRRARVPISFSTVPVRAEGDDVLERVTLGRLDSSWTQRGAGSVVECDTLALGFGFVASSELARQCGCISRWTPEAGGWVIEHDEWMRTSVPRIFVAGEVTGVAGAEQALEEGRLAGLGALVELRAQARTEAHARAQGVRSRLRARRRFSGVVRQRFAVDGPALAKLADDDTVVCRCEEVSAGSLREALAVHPHLGTLDAVKLLTRVGMGPCQGRMCQWTVSHLVAAASGRAPAALGPFRARPPIKPVALANLADAFVQEPAARADAADNGGG